ncbi:hypothetical protein TNCV_4272161 [Trichonephila clavipes]|nr:hypothetical protein TNCV_4272161 [Trichonephila clavipes]
MIIEVPRSKIQVLRVVDKHIGDRLEVKRKAAYLVDKEKSNCSVFTCGLSYRSIAARVGRDPMTVSRIGNGWVKDGNTERREESQRPPNTISREDMQVNRMSVL